MMDRNDGRVGRGLVIAGFVLMAMGAVITMTRFIVDGYLFHSASFAMAAETILSPLATVMAVWAWWWLTQVTAIDPPRVRAMRRGLYCLSLQYLFTFAMFTTIILSMNSSVATFSYLVQWWAQSLGALAISAGFFITSRSLHAAPALERAVAIAEPDSEG